MKRGNAKSRELLRDTKATEIAEFAAILPVLLMILIGIFWFGQAFRIYGTITYAAREGARAAVAPVCATCAGTNTPAANAWNAVQTAMSAANLDATQLRRPPVSPSLCPCVASLIVSQCTGTSTPPPATCDGSQSNICVQGTNDPNPPPEVLLSNSTSGGAGTCGVSVSFQYPYTFWLPGASIGNRTVYLQAQAEMRSENQ
jgi:Flp pilus assembly protein TadG